MSLYSAFQFGAAHAIPDAGLADVTDASLNVRVEEEQMLVRVAFKGTILGGGAGDLTVGFTVDGVALPLLSAGQLLAAGEHHLHVEETLALTKGQHVIRLQMNDVATAGHTIDGGVYKCVFSVERVSNDALLGQGVNSKVQLAL